MPVCLFYLDGVVLLFPCASYIRQNMFWLFFLAFFACIFNFPSSGWIFISKAERRWQTHQVSMRIRIISNSFLWHLQRFWPCRKSCVRVSTIMQKRSQPTNSVSAIWTFRSRSGFRALMSCMSESDIYSMYYFGEMVDRKWCLISEEPRLVCSSPERRCWPANWQLIIMSCLPATVYLRYEG